MSYPDGLPSTAFCVMEGCNWRGGGVCVNCGDRLRCECGRFVTERGLADHVATCPTVVSASAHPGSQEGEG